VRGCGAERIVNALLFAPRLKVKAMFGVLPQLIKNQSIGEAYQIYVTDCLRMISENTAKQIGGRYIPKRYADFLTEPSRPKKTPRQIIADLEKSGAITVKRKGE
jgi:hypothetical protein